MEVIFAERKVHIIELLIRLEDEAMLALIEELLSEEGNEEILAENKEKL